MVQTVKAHLCDNHGDENISKLIWVAIVFVVGAIMLVLFQTAFKGTISNWFNNIINNWFNGTDNRFSIDSAE